MKTDIIASDTVPAMIRDKRNASHTYTLTGLNSEKTLGTEYVKWNDLNTICGMEMEAKLVVRW